jgi:hypothetical protein
MLLLLFPLFWLFTLEYDEITGAPAAICIRRKPLEEPFIKNAIAVKRGTLFLTVENSSCQCCNELV